MTIVKIIFLAIILQNLISIDSYDYCRHEVKLCGDEENRHIMCYKEQIEPLGEFVQLYPMTSLFVSWFLYWHNYFRNEVACGRCEGSGGTLPTATRMRELSWDYELEYLAGVHASRCNVKHDQCRNSDRIPLTGQNVAFEKTSGESSPPLKRAHDSINMWFSESKEVTAALIDSFIRESDKKYGHFTVLANDKVGRVGCAVAACKAFPNETKPWHFNFVTCNYDWANVEETNVYATGEPAQHCTLYGHFGRSHNFTCLCASTFNKYNSTVFFWF